MSYIMAKKTEEASIEASITPEEGAEPRVYELAFHIDPELSETEATKTYEALKAACGSEIIAKGEPEKIQLAYTISRSENAGRRDFDSAYFAWIAYEASGEVHAQVLEAVLADKRVIRFLDIRTTKEEAKHSEEMSELRQMPVEAPVEEAASDAELDAALEGAAVV